MVENISIFEVFSLKVEMNSVKWKKERGRNEWLSIAIVTDDSQFSLGAICPPW